MTVCRHCGVEIERSSAGDKEVEYANQWSTYTNVVTEAWRETETKWWLICPVGGKRLGIQAAGYRPTWHEPLIESISDILDHLRLMESDLRP